MTLEKRHAKKEKYESPEQKPFDPPPEYFDAVFQFPYAYKNNTILGRFLQI